MKNCKRLESALLPWMLSHETYTEQSWGRTKPWGNPVSESHLVLEEKYETVKAIWAAGCIALPCLCHDCNVYARESKLWKQGREWGCKAQRSAHPPLPQMHQTALVLQPATHFLSMKNLRRKEALLARKLCEFQEEKIKDLHTHWTRHLVCSEDSKDKCFCCYSTMFLLYSALFYFWDQLLKLLCSPHSRKLVSLSGMKHSASKTALIQGQDKIECRHYDLSQRQGVRL